MLGTPGDLKNKKFAKKSIILIEDTAWGLGGKFDNKF